jgi:PAS domain S-box-containing protein
MTSIEQKEDVHRPALSYELILSFTADEEIIQFNRECERITGYRRDEVLHRKISEVLLSTTSLVQWKTLVASIQHNMRVDGFTLPLKTKQGTTRLVAWVGFLVKDANDSIKDVCLFGTCLEPHETTQPPFMPVPVVQGVQREARTPPNINVETVPVPTSTSPQAQQVMKKIMCTNEKATAEERMELERINDTLQHYVAKPLETMERTDENTLTKLDTFNKSITELSQNYDVVIRRLVELEKLKKRSKKDHTNLGKHMQLLEQGLRRHGRNQKGDPLDIKDIPSAEQPLSNKKITFFSDPFGVRKQWQELKAREQQLEERRKELDAVEAQLVNEEKTFNVRIEEFNRWREKLQLLETEIEKRRQELMKQERTFLEHTPHVSLEPLPPQLHIISTETESLDYHQILDKIPQSAVIVQRGILKQVNSSFATLIGYEADDIIEKSFFDFIAYEGLADVEKYYLDRLKGERVSAYRTVFSTKDNNKISVEVSIKPTTYNGEKAEIAIITYLETPAHQPMEKSSIKK